MEQQVQLTKQKTTYIDKEAIKQELKQLTYPLYFLDYETINTAIPMFDNTRPYQQIPAQYSLHIIETPTSPVQHKEFLHTKNSNPIPELVKSLHQNIGPTGTILVWNKSFEQKCNRNMAQTLPKESIFLLDLNARIYDLMLIFKSHYLDYRAKGSASIKKITPILIPHLSYTDLQIQEGGTASETILELMESTDKSDNPEREAQIEALLKYCERDTETMVGIFKVIKTI